jgi:uncharacterized coiled-coil DUF342 family protein
MEKIQAEIKQLNSQVQALQEERATLNNNNVESGENDSALAIVEAYRRQATKNPQIAAELQGIHRAIAFLEKQKHQRQTYLNQSQLFSKSPSQQQEELEAAKKIAQTHGQRINQLAGELATEIKLLKACADELSPMYWQVYYKPLITGLKTISVPQVRSHGEVWRIVNRIV